MTTTVGNPSIIAIVEGPGDKNAVPGLIRRILYERLERYDIAVSQSKVAHTKSKLVAELEKFLGYAIAENCDAILVLVDADGECPLEESANLVERAEALNLAIPVAIVYANSEYETWFICSLSEENGEGIRVRLGIPESVIAPDNAESIRGAKEWLNGNMPRDLKYQETENQENLTYHIDMNLTHGNSRSFRRLCHAVEELVHAIDNHISIVTPSMQ